MTEEGRREAVAEELALAENDMRVAERLLEDGEVRIAVSRAYYALFHAVRAQLYAEGLEPRTHKGLVSSYRLHFVKSGRYPAEAADLVSTMQREREEADYGGAAPDASSARGQLTACRELVDRITAALRPGP